MLDLVSRNRETNSSSISVEKPGGASPEGLTFGQGSCDFLLPEEIAERLQVTATEEQLHLYKAAIPSQGVDGTAKA